MDASIEIMEVTRQRNEKEGRRPTPNCITHDINGERKEP
jgi:hypothetical protein